MKLISYNINTCSQQKIDHLLRKGADIYIVPEMSDPKLLTIPEEYDSAWIGHIAQKGLGILWRKEINGTVKNYSSPQFNYYITLQTDLVLIVASWPTKYQETAKVSYPKLLMLTVQEMIDSISKVPTIIAGDFNCYVGQSGETKSYNLTAADRVLNEHGFRSLYHDVAGEKLGNESACTYHHLFHESAKLFIDYTYSNMPIKKYQIGEWEPSISDHHPQIIEF